MGYGRCFGFFSCFGVLVGWVLGLRSFGKGFWWRGYRIIGENGYEV